MEKTTVGINKFPAMITYIIAVACLLAGFILPINATGFGGAEDMLLLQLPNALGGLFGFSLSTPAFMYNGGYFTLFGASLNLYAILVLLYAVATIVSIAGLVIVCVSKKDSRFAVVFASIVEAVDITVLGLFLSCELMKYGMGRLDYWKWSFILSFAGVLLMLILHAIMYKKGSGVIKVILLLVSAFALCMTFGFSYLAYKTTDSLNISGVIVELLRTPDNFFAGGLRSTLLKLCTLALAVLVFINVFLDMIGLTKTTRKFMLVANVVRYALTIVVVLGMAVLSHLDRTMAITLLIIIAAAVVSLVINIIRLIKFCKAKRAKAAKTAKTANENAETEHKKAKENKKAEKATAVVAAADDEELVTSSDYISFELNSEKKQREQENENYIYRVGPLYQGPTDSFIKTLSNSEKVEFAKTFLERRKDPLPMIPDYVIDEDNTSFFSSVFIYYGKVSNLVSSGLMSKIYAYANNR